MMPRDAVATLLQESVKQDYKHISKHAGHNLYSKAGIGMLWLLALVGFHVFLDKPSTCLPPRQHVLLPKTALLWWLTSCACRQLLQNYRS